MGLRGLLAESLTQPIPTHPIRAIIINVGLFVVIVLWQKLLNHQA